MNETYKKQVGLLIKIVPLLYRIKEFAIHGGTAINLFVRDMPRYSVDLDVTYIPIKDRQSSLSEINTLLLKLKAQIERAIPNVKVVHKPAIWKLQCTADGATVKIEVMVQSEGLLEMQRCESYAQKHKTSSVPIVKLILSLFLNSMVEKLRQHYHVNIHEIYLIISTWR